MLSPRSAIIKRIMTLRDAGQANLAYFYFDLRDEYKQTSANSLPLYLFSSPPPRALVVKLSPAFIRNTGMAHSNPEMKP